ncbi:hypothetical protein, partial [Robertmurraya massiliosenegalensis]|uniref:hypothetical protein n=1 Tax=Robertmurraya massiliosenegalensis TaxID=1287657 RepID=UPI00047474DC
SLGNEVIKLCISNQFIEQQVYEISEMIKENTLYKFVGVELSENIQVSSSEQKEDSLTLINKVILEDENSTIYYVAPNLNGLRFAKKEITYREYKKLQKQETRNAIFTFLGILVGFGVLMVSMVKFLV